MKTTVGNQSRANILMKSRQCICAAYSVISANLTFFILTFDTSLLRWWTGPALSRHRSQLQCPRCKPETGSDLRMFRPFFFFPPLGDIQFTLWLFNIAMENGPFIDGLPIKNGDLPTWNELCSPSKVNRPASFVAAPMVLSLVTWAGPISRAGLWKRPRAQWFIIYNVSAKEKLDKASFI